jgi:integrase
VSVRKMGNTWFFEFMYEGRRYNGAFNGKNGMRIACDELEAKDFEAEIRIKVREGTYFKDASQEDLKLFSTFVDKIYLPFAREHHSEPAHDEFRCRELKHHFKGRKLDEVTTMMVEKYINDRLKSSTIRCRIVEGEKVHLQRSPTTVRKEVVLLSSIFNMAKQERLALENPCDFIRKAVRKKIPARVSRNRYLNLDEEKALFDEGLQGRRLHVNPIARIALLTGMRRGEILGLRKDMINFGTEAIWRYVKGERWEIRPGWFLIEKSKSGRPRAVPMSRRVHEILSRICQDDAIGEHVFRNLRTGLNLTEIKRAFTSAVAQVGIHNFVFHDLRHTWATRAAELGVPSPVRRDILGHAPVDMTDSYTHSTPESRARAMELVANYGEAVISFRKMTADSEIFTKTG